MSGSDEVVSTLLSLTLVTSISIDLGSEYDVLSSWAVGVLPDLVRAFLEPQTGCPLRFPL